LRGADSVRWKYEFGSTKNAFFVDQISIELRVKFLAEFDVKGNAVPDSEIPLNETLAGSDRLLHYGSTSTGSCRENVPGLGYERC
jgi:hypothetical protein